MGSPCPMKNLKYFGTDGVRGRANDGAITAQNILDLALATGRYFINGTHRHKVVIGKDTRLSGYMLEPTLTAGFISMGFDVFLLGPLPTPAVAMLTASLRADFGVMISASHNPAEDNGIKIFKPTGHKLSAEEEKIIEGYMDDPVKHLVDASLLGSAHRLEDARGRYTEMVKRVLPKGLRLDGMKIILDCAHGAAYRVAPDVFYELGAEVVVHANDPNGNNINDKCGAMHPDTMRDLVLQHKADLGVAFDGDADRVVMCDEEGRFLDGDMILAALALDMKERSLLRGPVVLTKMANLGLEKHLMSHDISCVRSDVGDRFVMQMMQEEGSNLGGETSGHIILGDHATTGDGMVTALAILSILVREKKKLSTLTSLFHPYPQIMRNIRFEGDSPLEKESIRNKINQMIKALPSDYRAVVRKSGTESLIRFMVEGEDEKKVNAYLQEMMDVL